MQTMSSFLHVFFLVAYGIMWCLYLNKYRTARQEGGCEAQIAYRWLAIPTLLGLSVWNAVAH